MILTADVGIKEDDRAGRRHRRIDAAGDQKPAIRQRHGAVRGAAFGERANAGCTAGCRIDQLHGGPHAQFLEVDVVLGDPGITRDRR